jgi:formate dehydrogenase assembly factor FdhD
MNLELTGRKGAPVVALLSAAHLSNVEQSEAFNLTLLSFLQDQRGYCTI